MIIQDYECKCPRCNTEQTYYRALTGGKYERPKLLDNECITCGHHLQKEDITNWDEVEEQIRGHKGWNGIP